MTGLERNADIVHMCSYAPLFAHAEGWQWTPDLIWFDNLRSYGTLNYYVQQLFSTNRGTHLLEMVREGQPLTGQNGLYATAVLDKSTQEIILKLVNSADKPQMQHIVLQSAKKMMPKAKMISLSSDRLDRVNSFNMQENLKPVEQEISLKGKKMTVTLPPYSLSVYRIKQR